MEDARRRADAELAALAAGSGWAVGDVAYAALLAARVMRKPKEKEPKARNGGLRRRSVPQTRPGGSLWAFGFSGRVFVNHPPKRGV